MRVPACWRVDWSSKTAWATLSDLLPLLPSLLNIVVQSARVDVIRQKPLEPTDNFGRQNLYAVGVPRNTLALQLEAL